VGDAHAEHVRAVLAALLAGKRVRGLVLTGFDADHADHRGVALILRRYQPDWILYPTYFKDSKSASTIFRKVIRPEEVRRASSQRPLTRHSISCDALKSRRVTDLTDEWSFTFFSPHQEDLNCSNNGSIVVKIEPKDRVAHFLGFAFSLLVTGDTENDRWEVMNRIYGANMKADVLMAPHHGSKNGINKRTLQHIAPHTVIISCGVGNQYGHPDAEAVRLYKDLAATVVCTGDGRSYESRVGVLARIASHPWSLESREVA
jgi:beta-lactamase superfamily II metal-dependent hydrolase